MGIMAGSLLQTQQFSGKEKEKIYDDMCLSINTEWVNSHQDSEPGMKRRLTWQAQQNISADQLAREARHKITDAQHKANINLLPACYAHLLLDNTPITSNVAKIVCNKWCSIDLKQCCHVKYGWTSRVFNTIGWSVSERIHSSNDFYKHRFFAIYVYQWLPLRGAKHSPISTTTCPCCKSQQEDHTHFQACKQNTESWDAIDDALRTAMETKK
eukprot:2205188-Ditylum_brightwellii.AAC.1